MSGLQVIEYSNQRVLTTLQLAESFGAERIQIQQNFSHNKGRYIESKHYFVLQGDALKQFASELENFEGQNLTKIRVLYLWTEKGAWIHAKSLNTDEAWDAYERLVDDYYTIKQSVNVVALDERKVRMELLKTAIDHEERIEHVENRIDQVERKVDEQITLNSGEQRKVQKAIAHKVYDIEQDPACRSDLFRQLHREIKDRWAVSSYKDVRHTELFDVLRYIDAWKPRIA